MSSDEMSSDDLDVDAIARELRTFAGETKLLDAAKTIEDFGSLRLLAVANVPFNGDLPKWRRAIREVILEAANSIRDPCVIHDGRVKAVTVPAASLREAIIKTFNLAGEAELYKAEVRRREAKRILGLDCSDRAYRDNPGPQRELIDLLAGKLVVLAGDIEGVRTEGLGIYMALHQCFTPIHDRQTEAIATTTKYARIVRALANGGSRVLHQDGELLGLSWTWQKDFEPLHGCKVETLGRRRGPRKTILRFPPMYVGERRIIGYGMNMLFRASDPIWVQPVEQYDQLSLRLQFAPHCMPRVLVYAFRDRKRVPRIGLPGSIVFDGDGIGDPLVGENGNYWLKVEKPTPFMYYGFTFLVLGHEGGLTAEKEQRFRDYLQGKGL